MKKLFTVLLLTSSIWGYGQVPENIKVNQAEKGSSEKVNLDIFYLNHVLYIKGFVLSNIYSAVSAEEMGFIDSTLQKNLAMGRRTQFIIQTEQRVPYRLAVFCLADKNKKQLVILTNFNPNTGKFERKIRDNHYANKAEIKDGIVLGNMFELPLKNENKYRDEKDYLSLINMSIFNGLIDTTQISDWFQLTEQTQGSKINNLNYLKSYFFLYQRDFEKSKEYLNALKKSVKESPKRERNQWAMFIKVLRAEIDIMEAI